MTEIGDLFATEPALLAGCVFVLSLLVGSFLNVVIHRLPTMLDREWQAQARELLDDAPAAESADTGATMEYAVLDVVAFESAQASPRTVPPRHETPYNLLVPRSRCPHCDAEIRAHQNIPVVSYLLLGGRCANCGSRISPRYPIVELVTALLSAAVALRFGWHWQTLGALILTWSLVALTVIDLDHTLLPDVITLPLLWLGLALSLAWDPGLLAPAPVDVRSAVLGALAGYLSLWSVYWVFKLVTGKEGMGYGDFKLFGALGAWLGWQLLPLVLVLASAAGAVVGLTLVLVRGRDRNVPLPFGPYLAVAGWIALMWGPRLVDTYLVSGGFAP